VVATPRFRHPQQYAPLDATTIPPSSFKAALMPEYKTWWTVIRGAHGNVPRSASCQPDLDSSLFRFGVAILQIGPGAFRRRPTPTGSFECRRLVEKGCKFHRALRKARIPPSGVLIQDRLTWEGTRAAEVLQKEGIHCNMTLLFSLAQAVACAQVKAPQFPLRGPHPRLV